MEQNLEPVPMAEYRCSVYHVITDGWQVFSRDTLAQARTLARSYVASTPHSWAEVRNPAGTSIVTFRS